MRGGLAKGIVLLATGMASMCWAQSISSLQSAFIEGAAHDVTGITSGTTVGGGGFVLIINGAFNVNNFQSVQWLNTATNVTTTFTAPDVFVSPTQLSLVIPNALFAAIVA